MGLTACAKEKVTTQIKIMFEKTSKTLTENSGMFSNDY